MGSCFLSDRAQEIGVAGSKAVPTIRIGAVVFVSAGAGVVRE